MSIFKGQNPDIGKQVRAAGLLKRINDEILKPAGFVLHFEYDDDPNKFGPYEIHIEVHKLDTKKKPKSKKEHSNGSDPSQH